jgi:hypothetical protein
MDHGEAGAVRSARPKGENAGGVEDVLDVFYCKYVTVSAFL